jgi:hypothetical protein
MALTTRQKLHTAEREGRARDTERERVIQRETNRERQIERDAQSETKRERHTVRQRTLRRGTIKDRGRSKGRSKDTVEPEVCNTEELKKGIEAERERWIERQGKRARYRRR